MHKEKASIPVLLLIGAALAFSGCGSLSDDAEIVLGAVAVAASAESGGPTADMAAGFGTADIIDGATDDDSDDDSDDDDKTKKD